MFSSTKKKKSISNREVAKKTKTSQSTVQRVKKHNHLRTYKKQKRPKRSEEQAARAKTRSGRLYKILVENPNRCILMDDETYIKMDTRVLPGPQFYTKMIGETLPDAETSLGLEKFGEKVLVWQAICSCGLKSWTLFTKGTVNGEIYRKECIQKRLLPLYRKHDTPPLFWPDLASAHYAKATITLLQQNNVEFVEKDSNPPNCPELRPIERYWAIVKRELRKKGEVATNMAEFKKIWNSSSRKVTRQGVQNLMKRAFSKLRAFYRNKRILKFLDELIL